MQRDRIIDFVDRYLDSKNIKDSSQNGLQVEGKPEVKKIAFGVSASLELFKRAAEAGADMIIVHHGLLWGRSFPVKGPFRKKLELLLNNGITLAAWHLPLDKHPVAGNNARIMKLLGAGELRPFGTYDGETIGFRAAFRKTRPLGDVIKTLQSGLSADILSFNFGPKKIRTLGAVSGGGQRMFDQAIAAGLDLYITGEVSEFVQETAREHRANYIAAGHYNTEKTGVWALEKLLRAKFGVETEFIDVPNPV
ncbi:MAG: Nif3-like dinuclear metal center hexameric protein [Elusimicrobia bacterium GWA2_56_46]|nr:MAG: Nif3-like dinuclear metal center hexameric protein [Elusimicrobia bacterium GWA2_56_46]OGR56218.1 MAG: Nif3-like dinuclear metal center hexameric protein [Elusimicrobia bacterium GWC2_56_31]HBB66954.1 Nif3-like dinuclear metal center hexameric protein [Elusimicrobiota bacterium]HBW23005.1 Nif3-like dinuclear metal center hexameric protein [Elusimicrobiota bacterium]